ncbi:substrate binding domain-containing protein [Roseibium salinum]|nr:substrate binding domain-containing protein [Roseibium salinum]
MRLEVDMTDRLVDLVAEGYDMAIRGAPLPDSSLIARKLGGNPRVLCASPVYLARKGTPHRPEDLRNHDCIGFDPMPVWYFNGPDGEIAHHIEDPVISGDSGDFAYDAAIHGLGLTVKSVAHVWEDLRDGRLVAVLEDYPIARTGNIYAVYPPGQIHTAEDHDLCRFPPVQVRAAALLGNGSPPGRQGSASGRRERSTGTCVIFPALLVLFDRKKPLEANWKTSATVAYPVSERSGMQGEAAKLLFQGAESKNVNH